MYFRLRPGVEALTLDDGSILFVSDWVRLRLEGASAGVFSLTLLPLLERWRTPSELLSAWPGLSEANLVNHLVQLGKAGILQQQEAVEAGADATSNRFLDIVGALGGNVTAAAARLESMRIVVFGVEDIGAHLVCALRSWRLRELLVADPFPPEPGNLAEWPFRALAAQSRQRAVVESLKTDTAALVAGPEGSLTYEGVLTLARDADLLVGCFDRGYSASHQWINRAALALGIPAVFAACSGVRAVVGPWVFPGESACYMCWRMRAIAAQPSFDKTMAYEQHTDRHRLPAAAVRPCLPGLALAASGHVATEIATTLLGLAVPALANAVMEIDGLEKTQQRHAFLHRPDCPHCAGLYKAVRTGASSS